MGLGVSLILIAAGAVLAWAVHVTTTGVNVNTVGYILLVVGIVGALLSRLLVQLGRAWILGRAPPHVRRRGAGTEVSDG